MYNGNTLKFYYIILPLFFLIVPIIYNVITGAGILMQMHLFF
jgi:hypothetical protein